MIKILSNIWMDCSDVSHFDPFHITCSFPLTDLDLHKTPREALWNVRLPSLMIQHDCYMKQWFWWSLWKLAFALSL